MLGLSRRHHRRAVAEGRGRGARHPGEIPSAGWRDVLLRVKDEQAADNMSIVAAGVAFYFLLSIFPALAATVSIWGLFVDPQTIPRQLEPVSGLLPADAYGILEQQLVSLSQRPGQGLGFAALLGIVIALWSASNGVKSLMTALNIAYEETEGRGFIRYNLTALVLTLGAIVMVPLSLAIVAAIPAVLGVLGPGGGIEWLIRLARWPLVALLVMAALAVLYRYGPHRARPRWEWVSWGAVAATTVWLFGSIAFSIYVSNFGSYDETYGSFGAIVILLLWFNLSAYVVLLGAELNAEMEHQTAHDTTTGREAPLGARGARMADTVGRRP